MHVAGSYADHVTRYNRKPNRWMPDMPVKRETGIYEIVTGLIIAACSAGAIAFGMMLLGAM